jgi:hypothetical protein
MFETLLKSLLASPAIKAQIDQGLVLVRGVADDFKALRAEQNSIAARLDRIEDAMRNSAVERAADKYVAVDELVAICDTAPDISPVAKKGKVS